MGERCNKYLLKFLYLSISIKIIWRIILRNIMLLENEILLNPHLWSISTSLILSTKRKRDDTFINLFQYNGNVKFIFVNVWYLTTRIQQFINFRYKGQLYLIFVQTYLIHNHYIISYAKFCLLNIVAEHYCVTARIFFFYNFAQGTLDGIAISFC